MIAASLHQIVRAGFPDQHVMLACRPCDDPRVGLRYPLVPVRSGMPPVAQQRTMMPRQPFDAVMNIVGAPGRDRRQRRKIARHRIGPHCFTLDEPGIAIAGLAPGLIAIDQHD